MKPLGRSIVVARVLLAGPLPAAHSAGKPDASDFPNKPIRWVIPFPPGGSNDMLSRFLGAKLTVDSPPDGYTILFTTATLAVTTAKRSPTFPDLSTMSTFYPGFTADNWYAMFVRTGTPKSIIAKINAETQGAEVAGGRQVHGRRQWTRFSPTTKKNWSQTPMA